MTKDIIIDDDGDLIFADGDFTIKNSEEQHAVLVINLSAGSLKQFPTCGVGIAQYLGSSGKSLELKRNMSVQLLNDGFTNVEVTITSISDQSVDYYINADRL